MAANGAGFLRTATWIMPSPPAVALVSHRVFYRRRRRRRTRPMLRLLALTRQCLIHLTPTSHIHSPSPRRPPDGHHPISRTLLSKKKPMIFWWADLIRPSSLGRWMTRPHFNLLYSFRVALLCLAAGSWRYLYIGTRHAIPDLFIILDKLPCNLPHLTRVQIKKVMLYFFLNTALFDRATRALILMQYPYTCHPTAVSVKVDCHFRLDRPRKFSHQMADRYMPANNERPRQSVNLPIPAQR